MKKAAGPQGKKGHAESSSEEASASESSSSGSDSGTEAPTVVEAKRRKVIPSSKAGPKEISLLDLDDFTPPPPQPVPSSSIISTSLVTDLEGLTLTDTSLAPAVSVLHVPPVGYPNPCHPWGGLGGPYCPVVSVSC